MISIGCRDTATHESRATAEVRAVFNQRTSLSSSTHRTDARRRDPAVWLKDQPIKRYSTCPPPSLRHQTTPSHIPLLESIALVQREFCINFVELSLFVFFELHFFCNHIFMHVACCGYISALTVCLKHSFARLIIATQTHTVHTVLESVLQSVLNIQNDSRNFSHLLQTCRRVQLFCVVAIGLFWVHLTCTFIVWLIGLCVQYNVSRTKAYHKIGR